MKSYSSKEVIAILLADGWYEINIEVTLPHPLKDINIKLLKSIEAERQGVNFSQILQNGLKSYLRIE